MAQRKKAGSAAPTSRDVAALAGVAQSTVSAVMSGKRAVSPQTRLRIENAMRELHYQPNAGARTLRTSKTNVIGLIVHLGEEVDAAETAPYIDTIIEEARALDYDVVLSTKREGPAGIVRLAGRSICDAFVVMDIQTHDDRVAAAAEIGRPVVLVGRPDDARGLDVVDFDSRRSAELLVDELALTGHRYIAVLGEPQDSGMVFRFIEDFYDGARDRAAMHGIALVVVPRPTEGWPGIASVADELLAHHTERLGIIARTQRIAEGVDRLLQVRGLVPGRDVSIAAMCTDDAALTFSRPVTNVSPQPRKLSSRAMHLLFERLCGADGPARTELIEPEGLVRRQSTAHFLG